VFVWNSEESAIISVHSIKLSVFITEAENVYCEVRAESSNQRERVSSLKAQITGHDKINFTYNMNHAVFGYFKEYNFILPFKSFPTYSLIRLFEAA
jgi:hypothetical protein